MTKLDILGIILSPFGAVIGGLGIASEHPSHLALGISLILTSQALYWLQGFDFIEAQIQCRKA